MFAWSFWAAPHKSCYPANGSVTWYIAIFASRLSLTATISRIIPIVILILLAILSLAHCGECLWCRLHWKYWQKDDIVVIFVLFCFHYSLISRRACYIAMAKLGLTLTRALVPTDNYLLPGSCSSWSEYAFLMIRKKLKWGFWTVDVCHGAEKQSEES